MTFTSWHRRQPQLPDRNVPGQGQASGTRGRQHYCRPHLEPLEDRYLLSLDMTAVAQSLIQLSAGKSAPSGVVAQTQIANMNWGGTQTVLAASYLVVSVGQPFTAAVAGISPAGPESGWQAAIDWGDGTQSACTFVGQADGVELVVAAKTYTRPGSFAVTIRVGNGTGAVITIQTVADVTDNGNGPLAGSEVPSHTDNSGSGSGPDVPVSVVTFSVSLASGIPQVVIPQVGGQVPPGKPEAGQGTPASPVVVTQGPATPATRLIQVDLHRSHFDASGQSVYQGNIDRSDSPLSTSISQAAAAAQASTFASNTQHAGLAVDKVMSWHDTTRSELDEATTALTPELLAMVLCSTWGMDGRLLLMDSDASSSGDGLEEDYFSPLTLLRPADASTVIANAAAASEGREVSSEQAEENSANRWQWSFLRVAAVCAVFQTLARFGTTTSRQPSLRNERE